MLEKQVQEKNFDSLILCLEGLKLLKELSSAFTSKTIWKIILKVQYSPYIDQCF